MSRIKVLETVLVLIVALGLVYWFSKNNYLLLAAMIIGATGLFFPWLAEKIHWSWMKLAEGLGYITGKITLTTIFVVFLIPISFAAKLFRRRAIIRTKRDKNSYFIERKYTYTKDSLENIW